MSDGDDWWNPPRRTRREAAQQIIAERLQTEGVEPAPAPQPPAPGLYLTDAERLAEHDRLNGLDGPLATSPERQKRLRVYMPHGRPKYEAGDSPEASPD